MQAFDSMVNIVESAALGSEYGLDMKGECDSPLDAYPLWTCQKCPSFDPILCAERTV